MRRIVLTIAGILFLILGVLLIYYMIAMSKLPPDDGDLGTADELLVLPERPGTQSLILTGPIIKPLVFGLDVSKPNLKSLDWSALQDVDPTADVTVNGRIGPDGSLLFDPIGDVYCPGHTKAGEMISEILRTWSYTPYKQGPITIRFNVGAVGKRVTIDISKLKRNNNVEPETPIQIGRLHLIEGGFRASELKIVSWK